MFDARAFTAAALSAPGFVLSPDGTLHAEEDAKRWISTASRVADRLTPEVELEDAAPIDVKKEDVDRVVARILGRDGQTTTATSLLEAFYEITPSNKTFPDDLANLQAALKGNEEVVWVGGDRYRSVSDVPEDTGEVPEPFHFVQTEAKDEEGEFVDVELTDEGLSQTLRRLLQHPLAVDVLDEDAQPRAQGDAGDGPPRAARDPPRTGDLPAGPDPDRMVLAGSDRAGAGARRRPGA